MPDLLPKEILWRKKEAFSDGVSSKTRSWYSIIEEKIINNQCVSKDSIFNNITNTERDNIHNCPTTQEQIYYREIFEKYFGNNNVYIIPYFWMPRFINAQDSSARTLQIYN